MRHLPFVSLITLLFPACATSPLVVEPQPLGYSDRVADAGRPHEKANARDKHIAEAVHAGPHGNGCSDTVLNDQLTTGGQRVTDYTPCWDYEDEIAHDRVTVVAQTPSPTAQAARAADERQAANAVVETEVAACATIPERERGHSPFAHRRSIAAVAPHYEAGQLRGVEVTFKPVTALTADWMRQDIACHQAHVAALGSTPDAMQQDPTLVLGAQVTVSDAGGHLVVVVRTDSPDQAALALARARGVGPTESVAMGFEP